jgi:hypothetical protein
VCIDVLHALVAGLLARSRYPQGPATGHLGTGFFWFPCACKRMLRWFPRLQVATACFSCSPPDLNFLDPYFIFMYRGADKSLAKPGRKQATTTMSKSSRMMDPTHSHEMPSCWAIDLAEIRRSSKISSWIWSIISGVVGLRTYQHPGTCIITTATGGQPICS